MATAKPKHLITKNLYLVHDESGVAGVYTSKARAMDASEAGDVISVIPVALLDQQLGALEYTPPTAAMVTYGTLQESNSLMAEAKAAAALVRDWNDEPDYVDVPPVMDEAELVRQATMPVVDEYAAAPPSTSFASGTIDLG